jgi:hypothetical protein
MPLKMHGEQEQSGEGRELDLKTRFGVLFRSSAALTASRPFSSRMFTIKNIRLFGF